MRWTIAELNFIALALLALLLVTPLINGDL
jgi:hypothetical protein